MVVSPAPPPPICAIFAFESDSELTTLKKNIEELQSDVDPSQWINIICVHNKAVLFYGDPQKLSLETRLDRSSEMRVLDSKEDSLFYFYVILVGHLSIAEERVPNIRAYVGVSSKTSWIQEATDSLKE